MVTRYRVTRVTEVILDTADPPNDGCVDEELAEAIARALPEGEWNVVGVEAERMPA